MTDAGKPVPKPRLPYIGLAVIFFAYLFTGWSFLRGIQPSLQLGMVAALVLLVPVVSALGEFALMAIAYALSAVLTIAAGIWLLHLELGLLLAIGLVWTGLVAVPLSGHGLAKLALKTWQIAIVLMLASGAGLGSGWALGRWIR